MIKFTIGFISVIIVFYMVGAFISGTLNCALWNVALKCVLAFLGVVFGFAVGIANTEELF